MQSDLVGLRNAVARDEAAVQKINFGNSIFGTGAFWGNSFFLAGLNGPLQAYQLNTSTAQFTNTSTSSHVPLLSQEKLAPILRERIDRPLFIIDIAVPRDVAPDVNELDGVYLYDIDSLQSIAEQSLATRRAQVRAAEEIIATHVSEFFELIARGLTYQDQGLKHPAVGESSLRTSEL